MKIIDGKCQECGVDKLVDYNSFKACINGHMQYDDKHGKERATNLILEALDEKPKLESEKQ